jgi:hypothetical protein
VDLGDYIMLQKATMVKLKEFSVKINALKSAKELVEELRGRVGNPMGPH